MSGAPQFPIPSYVGAQPLRPGGAAHKAGLSLEQRIEALERGALGRPGPGVVDGCVVTSDISQQGGARWGRQAVQPGLELMRALGSVALAASMDPLDAVNGGPVLTDGEVWFQALYLPYDATLTGVWAIAGPGGSFTPDNNCKVGLYTRSGSTFTRVAQSANAAGPMFGQATGSFCQQAFTGTYAASAGVYYVAMLANWSAVVVAPGFVGTAGSLLQAHKLGLTIGATAQLAGQTDLPASTSGAADTSRNNIILCGVY